MKVCVVGARAIGGYIAVRIAEVGHDVSVIARRLHLAAIRAKGVKLIEDEPELVASALTATDRIRDLGPQDVVLLALMAHQIEAVVSGSTPEAGYIAAPNLVAVPPSLT